MLYVDYTWDLDSQGILFDDELNIDKLGWKAGDYFKIVNRNGKSMLIKVDILEKFLNDGTKK